MSYAYAVKVLTDVMFYFAMVSTLTVSLGQTPRVIATPVLTAAAAFFCHLLSRNRRRWLRFLPLALLPAVLLFTRGKTDLVMSVPPALYLAWLLWKHPSAPEHGDALATFYMCLKITPFPMVLGALVGNWTAMRDIVLPYFFVFLALSVLQLRTLRHDAATMSQTRFKLLNLGSLAAVGVAGWLLSSGLVMAGLRYLGGLLVRFILRPLFMGVMYVFVGLVWLLGKAFEGLTLDPEGLDLEQLQESLDFSDMQGMFGEEGAAATESPIWDYVVMALGILAVVAILIILFRALAKGRAHRDDNVFDGERTLLEETERPQRLNPRENRQRVRQYYRKFLKLARQRGFELTEFMDSSEVERGTLMLFQNPAQTDLREVYVRARYSSAEVTDEDVREAKEKYTMLKKNEREG